MPRVDDLTPPGVGTRVSWLESPTAAGRGRSSASPYKVPRAMLIAEHPAATRKQVKERAARLDPDELLASDSAACALTHKKKRRAVRRVAYWRGGGQAAEIPGEGVAKSKQNGPGSSSTILG